MTTAGHVSMAAVHYSKLADQASSLAGGFHMSRSSPVSYLCISFCPGKAILEPYDDLYNRPVSRLAADSKSERVMS